MNEHEYDELVETATFCLLTRVPWKEALDMPEYVRQAFLEAYQQINKSRK